MLREQAREKERLSRALRRMLEAEVSKRRTFAKLMLQTKAESEGIAAILRDDACEGLECRTAEVTAKVFRLLLLLLLLHEWCPESFIRWRRQFVSFRQACGTNAPRLHDWSGHVNKTPHPPGLISILGVAPTACSNARKNLVPPPTKTRNAAARKTPTQPYCAPIASLLTLPPDHPPQR